MEDSGGSNVSMTGDRAPLQQQLPSHDERKIAIDEAEACLEAVATEGFQLDGFNLLGVVANPRTGLPSMPSSSSHAAAYSGGGSTAKDPSSSQQYSSGMVVSPSASKADQHTRNQGVGGGDFGGDDQQQTEDMFSGAVQSIEYTIAQVTEQIDSLNGFLEELSRQYLGDDNVGESLFLEYYYQDEEEQTTPQVPPELAELELQDLQTYLEESGVLAHSLFSQELKTRTLDDEETVSTDDLGRQLDEIPAIFYETDFDLTNPKTFVELLLQNAESIEASDNMPKKEKDDPRAMSLFQPTQELVPVREPDSLAGYLDNVELALQDQVRQKSAAFFHETTRFRQLQSSIEELLQQVQSLRNYLQQALNVYRQRQDISNHQRKDYERLVDVLDAAVELVRCKASISGLLSASDHLGAAQQIQYGRKLLKGMITEDDEREDQLSDNDNPPVPKLQNLTALSNSLNQFTQYESLVVQSLSDELVEIFLNWQSTERERVMEMIEALQLCQALSRTSELYQRRLQQLVRMTVRTTIAEFVEPSKSNGGSTGGGVTGMTYPAFYSCLQMLIEELQSITTMAHNVDHFCEVENLFSSHDSQSSGQGQQLNGGNQGQTRWTQVALNQAAELSTKSIAELLRLRKEAHSLITLDEMKQLWDTCLNFSQEMEGYGNTSRAVSLRSTLASQAKAYLDRSHESNMSALVAALDSERWTQCEVSAERQAALTRLCSGLAMVSTPVRSRQNDKQTDNSDSPPDKKPMAVVEGVNYRVVWSCLLLVEMIMTNLSSAAYFQALAPNASTKIMELMRLFNTRTSSLVLGAGAIHSAARLKSINAKHLSYVTQCLGMLTSLLPHIRAALMAQLPQKQHSLLVDMDNIKKEYQSHKENVLNKFVSIIGGIVEHGLAPRISGTDFDQRAQAKKADNSDDVECCVFIDGIANSTKKLHQVLNSLLPPDHLQDVFSRIFAYLDQKVPALFIESASNLQGGQNGSSTFSLPVSEAGKQQLLLEVDFLTMSLNKLSGVHPWDFTATNVLERRMDYKFRNVLTSSIPEEEPAALESPATVTKGIESVATPSNEEHQEIAAVADANYPANSAMETPTEAPTPEENHANGSSEGPTTDIEDDGTVEDIIYNTETPGAELAPESEDASSSSMASTSLDDSVVSNGDVDTPQM